MQQLPDSLEFEYVFDGESDLLVLQLSSQSGTHPELFSGLVCDCTDKCEKDLNSCQMSSIEHNCQCRAVVIDNDNGHNK